MVRTVTFRLALLVLACGLAAAMDQPAGVVAILAGAKEEVPCGGSAVVIAATDGALQAITLAEALPRPDHPGEAYPKQMTVVFPGGLRRSAEIVRSGTSTTAVLLRIADPPAGIQPMTIADSHGVQVGDCAWTAGNSYGSIELDGQVALSRGVVSGSYDIPADAAPVRGRGGSVLSAYRGPVFESDAAINDGNQGGPLLDGNGRVLGLVSLGAARERRLGTAVPIHLVLADLHLELALLAPAGPDPAEAALIASARRAAAGVALVYLERTGGLGNPQAVQRPPRTIDEVPSYDRKRYQEWWDQYYHMQQMFFTDQPVPALVVGPRELVTAATNLHGDAKSGRVLRPGRPAVNCTVVASNTPLDLVLLLADEPLGLPQVELAEAPGTLDEPVAVIGRHRGDGSFTITTGVVSAEGRRFRAGQVYGQTDALCNYGSMGGAVVDVRGRVLGMPMMMAPNMRWPWFTNSGVALYTEATAIADDLPRLRAGTSTTNAPLVGLGVVLKPRKDGRLEVARLMPGLGAEAGGVLVGDVLASVDGRPATSTQAVARALLPPRHKVGDTVALVVQRAGKDVELHVELKILGNEDD